MSSATATLAHEPQLAQLLGEPAADIVSSVAARIVPPATCAEQDRFADLADALARRDGRAAANLLSYQPERFSQAFALLPAYCLAMLASAELGRHGLPVADLECVLRLVREQTREELALLPASMARVWLIPATPAAQTETHVAALLLGRIGTVTRPWLWRGLPQSGRFRLVGAAAAEHYAASDRRCDGVTDFPTLARRCRHVR